MSQDKRYCSLTITAQLVFIFADLILLEDPSGFEKDQLITKAASSQSAEYCTLQSCTEYSHLSSHLLSHLIVLRTFSL